MTEAEGGPSQAEVEAAREEAVAAWQGCWAAAGVRSAVVLASTFRSGSTRVAATLAANGLPGLGKERFQQAWRCVGKPAEPAFAAFTQEVLAEVQDGVFATKIMWPHLVHLARAARLGRGEAPMLAGLFGDARWVQVLRQDKIAQAVSFWRAKQTGRWHVYRDEVEPVPDYDFQGIRTCLQEIEMDDRLWEDFFSLARIEPVRVTYEVFETDVAAEVRRILEGLARPVPEPVRTAITLRRQRDGLSQQYRERFLEDIYRGGPAAA